MNGLIPSSRSPKSDPVSARFGVFEVDFQSGEFRKHGLRVKLQDKPLRILQALLECPGDVVTRENLHARIGAAESEHSLTIAVNKLRAALCDSAENPRFVETVPRRGYRFIAPVRDVRSREREDKGLAPSRTAALGTAGHAQRSSLDNGQRRPATSKTKRFISAVAARHQKLLSGVLAWAYPRKNETKAGDPARGSPNKPGV